MSQHSRTLAILAFGVAIAVSGLALTKQVIAVAGEADAERLNQPIQMYIAEKNPQAPIKAFQGFPEILVAEAQRSNLDHCVSLAQAEVESEFRYDAVGSAGEIGLFQILPSTAALFESRLGQFRRPVLNKANRDLGDLASPIVSTKFAMAYLRDIMSRRATVREDRTSTRVNPRHTHTQYAVMCLGKKCTRSGLLEPLPVGKIGRAHV